MHLFFDAGSTDAYDLSAEMGRQKFLQECCYLKIQATATKEAAREIESRLEETGRYRYVGRVVAR